MHLPTSYSKNAPVHTWCLHREQSFESKQSLPQAPLTTEGFAVPAPPAQGTASASLLERTASVRTSPLLGQTAAPQHRTVTQGLHAQRRHRQFASHLPHPTFCMAGDLDFALFTLPRCRTNAFPSNWILIPHSCLEQNLHN